MPHPLTDRLDDLGRRLRRAGIVRGSALCVTAVVLGGAAAGTVDAVWRTEATAGRLLLTAVAVVPAVLVARRSLLPPLRSRLNAVDLARRVEERDPAWGGRLSAAAAFLADAPAFGSRALAEQVVRDATDRLTRTRLPDLADPAQVRRSVAWGAVVLMIGVAVIALSSSASKTALLRLGLPLAALRWPRDVDLVLIGESGDPLPRSLRVGRGQTLRFTVLNRHGPVPPDLTFEFVGPDRRRRSEPMPTAEQAGGEGEAWVVGVGALFAAEGPIRFRAVGGDHRDMPFVTAQVVPPPVFDRINVTVTPPDYLGLPATELPRGVANVAGVVGSSVTVTARANKPLGAAELRMGDATGPEPAVGPDGRSVRVTFPLVESGSSSYWFRLRDRDGFENPEATRYELRVTDDAAPKVEVSEPPADLRATADADLPIIIDAFDDFGLTWVRLRFGRGAGRFEGESAIGEEETQTIPLFEGPERPREGSYRLLWSLRPLELVPGDRLSFRGEAGDAYDLGLPHLGYSSPRAVSIVSAVEKRDELLDRQAGLLEELQQARRDEGRLGDAVEAFAAELTGGELGPQEKDQVARAEAEQRRLALKLTDARAGIGAQAARAALELRANRIDDAALAERLERITLELSSLRDDALAAAGEDLTEAGKAVAAKDAASALASARSHMGVVLGGLDSLLADLGAWQSRRDLGGEVLDLLSVQRELAEETEKVTAETLGATAGELTERQASRLERLGLRQSGLADRLERLGTTIDGQVSGPTGDAALRPSPEESDLVEASELLREAALPAAARAAGDAIRGNELGVAGRLQSQVADRLRALKELLDRPESPEGRVETLRKQVGQLEELAAAERTVAETLQKSLDGEGLTDGRRESLRSAQSRLREEAVDAARRLRDTGATSAEALLREASRGMAEALERLARRDDRDAGREAEDAAERLDQARSEAQRATERLAGRLARESLASSAESVSALSERQRAVNEEVLRLDRLKAETGRLSRSQLRTLRQAAGTQRGIAAETVAVATRLEAAAAVGLALGTAADRMALAANSLDGNDTGENVQRHGRQAKEALDRVAAALRPDAPAARNGGESRTTEDGGPPRETVPMLAQLELLKGLQEDLLRRTEGIDAMRREGTSDFSVEQEAELVRIREEQAALTESFERLVGGAMDAEEESR